MKMQANIMRPPICIRPCLFSFTHFGLSFLHLSFFIYSSTLINTSQLSISYYSCNLYLYLSLIILKPTSYISQHAIYPLSNVLSYTIKTSSTCNCNVHVNKTQAFCCPRQHVTQSTDLQFMKQCASF